MKRFYSKPPSSVFSRMSLVAVNDDDIVVVHSPVMFWARTPCFRLSLSSLLRFLLLFLSFTARLGYRGTSSADFTPAKAGWGMCRASAECLTTCTPSYFFSLFRSSLFFPLGRRRYWGLRRGLGLSRTATKSDTRSTE